MLRGKLPDPRCSFNSRLFVWALADASELASRRSAPVDPSSISCFRNRLFSLRWKKAWAVYLRTLTSSAGAFDICSSGDTPFSLNTISTFFSSMHQFFSVSASRCRCVRAEIASSSSSSSLWSSKPKILSPGDALPSPPFRAACWRSISNAESPPFFFLLLFVGPLLATPPSSGLPKPVLDLYMSEESVDSASRLEPNTSPQSFLPPNTSPSLTAAFACRDSSLSIDRWR
mmetsp:Transcript_69835/g.195255  ORF Transcript_69835/g.195255 Transcript_69835/m.195255 type:complete len:230 (-) Transcript_69835:450-1139(-)